MKQKMSVKLCRKTLTNAIIKPADIVKLVLNIKQNPLLKSVIFLQDVHIRCRIIEDTISRHTSDNVPLASQVLTVFNITFKNHN